MRFSTLHSERNDIDVLLLLFIFNFNNVMKFEHNNSFKIVFKLTTTSCQKQCNQQNLNIKKKEIHFFVYSMFLFNVKFNYFLDKVGTIIHNWIDVSYIRQYIVAAVLLYIKHKKVSPSLSLSLSLVALSRGNVGT
jgi:hypothetical protein